MINTKRPLILGVVLYTLTEKENMENARRFIFLSDNFFCTYNETEYPEIEHKPDRPYMQMYMDIDGVKFAMPFRSHIRHQNAFWTNREQRCGLDYSKAVVVNDESYIDTTRTPYLRPEEFDALRGKDAQIKRQMKSYLNYPTRFASDGDSTG